MPREDKIQQSAKVLLPEEREKGRKAASFKLNDGISPWRLKAAFFDAKEKDGHPCPRENRLF